MLMGRGKEGFFKGKGMDTIFTYITLHNICVFFALCSIITYFIWYGVILFTKRKKRARIERDGSAFHHYFIIPCLNEEVVLGETLAFWHQFIEQSDKDIHCLFVDDGSTDRTREILNQFSSPHFAYLLRDKPHAQEGKGEVLNYALQYIYRDTAVRHLPEERVIITVFDADARIYQPFMDAVETEFCVPDVALTQARVAIHEKRGWLHYMQDMEFYAVIDAIQKVREHLGTVAAGGNGQSVRLSSLQQNTRPWGNALLEDYEFSLRLLLEGFKTAYITAHAVYQQAPIGYGRFVKQRARWCQGGIQCFKYAREIRQSPHLPFLGKIEYFYFLLLPFISIVGITAIGYLALEGVLSFVLSNGYVFDGWAFGLVLLFTFLPSMIWVYIYVIQRSLTWKERLYMIVLAPTGFIYILALVPVQVLAIKRYFNHQNSWEKTERFKQK